jgi:hypothetical protein
MNGLNFAPPGGATAWTEHRTPDNRVYYYNALTKVTQWTKPEEMMTPAEVRCACLLASLRTLLLRARTDCDSVTARSGQPALERIYG